MFNSTTELSVLFKSSYLFLNNDEDHCPTTSYSIKNTGCLTDYSGKILSLNENNETLARMNSTVSIDKTICIEAKNKDQTIWVDQIKYVQSASCREYITVN